MININNYILEKLHIGKDINDTPVYKEDEIVLEICASSKSNMLLFYVCKFRGYKNDKLTLYDLLTKQGSYIEPAKLNSYGFYEAKTSYGSTYLVLPIKQAEEFISELLKYENKDLFKFPFENYFDNPINKETMNGALRIPNSNWASVRDLQYRFKQLNK